MENEVFMGKYPNKTLKYSLSKYIYSEVNMARLRFETFL